MGLTYDQLMSIRFWIGSTFLVLSVITLLIAMGTDLYAKRYAQQPELRKIKIPTLTAMAGFIYKSYYATAVLVTLGLILVTL